MSNSSGVKTAKNLQKYIMTPDYKPLFALGKAFGPTHGPLDRPVPTTVEIIGKLLKQSGRDAVTIFEVKKVGQNKYTKPVQLTLKNYMMDYDDIVAGKKMSDSAHTVVDLNKEPVSPKVVTNPKKEEPVTSIPGGKPKNIVHELDDSVGVVDTLHKVGPGEAIPKEDMQQVEPEKSEPKAVDTLSTPVSSEEAAVASEPEALGPEAESAEEEAQEEAEVESEGGEDMGTVEEAPAEEPSPVADLGANTTPSEKPASPVSDLGSNDHKMTRAERKAMRRQERDKVNGSK